MIVPATLAGRCSNGYERDQGKVVHGVECDGKDIGYYARSMCNKTHGSRSAGWAIRKDLQINCQRCARALVKVKP